MITTQHESSVCFFLFDIQKDFIIGRHLITYSVIHYQSIQIYNASSSFVIPRVRFFSCPVSTLCRDKDRVRGRDPTLLTVYSNSLWRVIFQPPGVYLQDMHPFWETHQCHTLAVGSHIAQCWVSAETTRVGLVWQINREFRAALLCAAALLELRLIMCKAILEQAFISCERSQQCLHERVIRSLKTKPPAHPDPRCLSWLQLLRGADIGFFYISRPLSAVQWKLQMEGGIIDEYLLVYDERSKWYKCVPFQWSIQPCAITVICGKGRARNDFGSGGESPA